MKIRDLIKVEEAQPLDREKYEIPILGIENRGIADIWLRKETQNLLDNMKNTPWYLQQQKAIAGYREKRFTLKKQIHFYCLVYPRSTEGYTLSQEALKVFDERTRNYLLKGLSIPGITLASVQDLVWCLPTSYLRFEKKDQSNNLDLFDAY